MVYYFLSMFAVMKREMLSKKTVLLFGMLACLSGKAQNLPDSVVMTVGGKAVPLSEFTFIAQKNGEADFSNSKTLNEYVELFKNFKLKVVEAEAQGMDTTEAFTQELEGYEAQLKSSYWSDKTGEEEAVKAVYDRGNELLEFSYILIRMPRGNVLAKDSLPAYQEAMDVYERLQKGEDIDALGKAWYEEDKGLRIVYEHVPTLPPLRAPKVLERALYELPAGQLSLPVRTSVGYYIVKMHSRKAHPGLVRASHILISFKVDSVTRSKEEALAIAEEVLQKIQAEEDFAELAKTYSNDPGSAANGGTLRAFGLGEMVQPFEQAAFALNTPGEVSGLVESRFGYHIIKLIEKLPRPSFDTEKNSLQSAMAKNEHNFELYKAFDDRMKKEHDYVFYPDAYTELAELCNELFPSDSVFYETAKDMNKPLFSLQDQGFPQSEFARFMSAPQISTKTFALDFLQEAYDLFVRAASTAAEQSVFNEKHPEYAYLMQEYRDGILLFEISNREVWTKPVKKQASLEKKWIKALNKKYPVVINWEAITKLRK
ncbi:Peptidyl-prolyl cis-trans isomerase surA [Bacteroidales bacterium Barb6]|nr:Peptidyl-prolyl cis-trans isomerase surA [Bacteroidales bacterium Barb6]